MPPVRPHLRRSEAGFVLSSYTYPPYPEDAEGLTIEAVVQLIRGVQSELRIYFKIGQEQFTALLEAGAITQRHKITGLEHKTGSLWETDYVYRAAAYTYDLDDKFDLGPLELIQETLLTMDAEMRLAKSAPHCPGCGMPTESEVNVTDFRCTNHRCSLARK